MASSIGRRRPRRRRRRIHSLPLLLLLWISLAFPIEGSPRGQEGQALDCVYRCGNTTVPYPFFIASSSHHSCGHRKLHCEHATLKLKLSAASYRVLGFSRSNVIIIDPQGCGGAGGDSGAASSATTATATTPSFTISNNTNYALSFGNLLMLYGCTNNTACYNNCNFNSRAVHWPYAAGGQRRPGCGTPQCCYDLQFASLPALRDIDLGSFNCSGFSSLVTTFKEKGEDVSVEAREGLGLEWWLNGKCPAAAAAGSLCARNAVCVPGTFEGHTCRCVEKFHGDPYRAGCRPVGRRHSKVVRGSIMFAGILAGATVLAAVVIALALLAARSRHHRRRHRLASTTFRSMRDAKQLAKLVSRTASSKAVTLFSYKDLERATKGFSPAQMLGHGGHGTVYKGKLPDGRDVAVKRINHMSSHGIEQVLNEVKVLLSVSHPNLVQLLGCCLEVYDPLLVYEFVANGTLAEHLQRERGDGLEWFTRVAIAAEAAQAIAYLHSRSPPIYHRDVKSTNILLDDEFNTKVGDFGLSRTVLTEASHVSTAPQGTPGYVDPDYHQSFQLSDKSDVYSFGVVLVEMITSMKVVDFTRDKREVNLAALAVGKIATDCLDEIIDPALMIQASRNPVVRCMIQRMAELAFRCLAHEKDARPSMAEVFDEVEGIRHSSLSPGDHSPIRDIKIDESLLTPR